MARLGHKRAKPISDVQMGLNVSKGSPNRFLPGDPDILADGPSRTFRVERGPRPMNVHQAAFRVTIIRPPRRQARNP